MYAGKDGIVSKKYPVDMIEMRQGSHGTVYIRIKRRGRKAREFRVSEMTDAAYFATERVINGMRQTPLVNFVNDLCITWYPRNN